MTKLKTLFACAGAALIGLASINAAVAADLRPVYRAPPPVMAPVSVYNWTGFYVGVNGGGIWSGGDSEFLIGGTLGYNWQQPGSPFVFGLEGDIDWVSGGGHSYFATARGRIGYAVDRWMIYATGGAAFTDLVGSNVGGTVGAGLEYAITPSVSVKGEYLFAGFSHHDD